MENDYRALRPAVSLISSSSASSTIRILSGFSPYDSTYWGFEICVWESEVNAGFAVSDFGLIWEVAKYNYEMFHCLAGIDS